MPDCREKNSRADVNTSAAGSEVRCWARWGRVGVGKLSLLCKGQGNVLGLGSHELAATKAKNKAEANSNS